VSEGKSLTKKELEEIIKNIPNNVEIHIRRFVLQHPDFRDYKLPPTNVVLDIQVIWHE